MADSPLLGRLLILSTTCAGAEPYLEAAQKLRVESLLALEETAGRCAEGGEAIRLRFAQRDSALAIVQYAIEHPLAAIVASAPETAPTCARAASMLGMKWHPPRAADLCLDKFALRQRLSNAGFRVPMLGETGGEEHVSLTAVLSDGKMRLLGATESRGQNTSKATDSEISRQHLETALRAARAAGLTHGPLWMQLRIAAETPWITDLSPAIPASEMNVSRFRIPLVDEEISVAEVILRHALGIDLSRIVRR